VLGNTSRHLSNSPRKAVPRSVKVGTPRDGRSPGAVAMGDQWPRITERPERLV
jgi:hypothetical protein